MKKNKIIVGILVVGLLVFSCENSVSPKNNSVSNKRNEKKVSRSVKVGRLDEGEYFDITKKEVNAKEVKIEEFNNLISRSYENKDTIITFDTQENVIKVSKVGEEGINFRYEYQLKSANENLMYLCPKDYKKVEYYKNNIRQEVNKNDFIFYISLYGWGENRLEVSEHLKDMSAVNGGTYWKNK